MKKFIEDTEKRIEIATQQLIDSTNEAERKELISKLNNLVTLKQIYIKIHLHNNEAQMTL